MFGDLDWPLNASRGFVSISWASCFTGKDVCEATLSFGSERKGDIRWPDTLVGRRRSVRCAYAYTQPVFVRRACTLVNVSDSFEAQWAPWSYEQMDACPDPPFSRQVQQLYDRLVIIIPGTGRPRIGDAFSLCLCRLDNWTKSSVRIWIKFGRQDTKQGPNYYILSMPYTNRDSMKLIFKPLYVWLYRLTYRATKSWHV